MKIPVISEPVTLSPFHFPLFLFRRSSFHLFCFIPGLRYDRDVVSTPRPLLRLSPLSRFPRVLSIRRRRTDIGSQSSERVIWNSVPSFSAGNRVFLYGKGNLIQRSFEWRLSLSFPPPASLFLSIADEKFERFINSVASRSASRLTEQWYPGEISIRPGHKPGRKRIDRLRERWRKVYNYTERIMTGDLP